jgi:hypothetical protein
MMVDSFSELVFRCKRRADLEALSPRDTDFLVEAQGDSETFFTFLHRTRKCRKVRGLPMDCLLRLPPYFGPEIRAKQAHRASFLKIPFIAAKSVSA